MVLLPILLRKWKLSEEKLLILSPDLPAHPPLYICALASSSTETCESPAVSAVLTGHQPILCAHSKTFSYNYNPLSLCIIKFPFFLSIPIITQTQTKFCTAFYIKTSQNSCLNYHFSLFSLPFLLNFRQASLWLILFQSSQPCTLPCPWPAWRYSFLSPVVCSH